jgi:ABC-type glycerol-3-phosphate transport system substrate-binding protein
MRTRHHGRLHLVLVVALCLPALLPLGRADARSTGSMAAAGVPASALAPFRKAKINWRQAAGQTINVALTDEFDTDVLKKQLPLFEALTGIKVQWAKYMDVTQKLTVDFVSHAGTIDVGHIDNMYIPEDAGSGYLEPLDPYLKNPSLTDPKWFNYGDLVPAFAGLGKWNGTTYGLPEYIETSLVLYRKDLATKAGITKAPATWQDFADDCRRMNNPPKIYGCAFDALKGSDQNIYRWTMVARAFGGNFFRHYPNDLYPTVNSPQNVAATTWYANTLRKYGPPGVANWGWYETDSAGQQGKIAMEFESYDTALVLDDHTVSKTAGKWGVWPIPAGPGGRWPSAFSWLLGINARSQHKVAAWLFLEFADSYASQVLKTTDQPFTDRTSIWSNRTIMSRWAKLDYGEWLPVVNEMFKAASSDFRPRFTGWGQFGDRLSLAVQAAVAGTQPAKAALDAAEQDEINILRQGGYLH